MGQPNTQKCANCEGTDFQRIEGLYALTKVEKKDSGAVFMPASGIPVIVYMCKKCGEMKLFPARLFGEI